VGSTRGAADPEQEQDHAKQTATEPSLLFPPISASLDAGTLDVPDVAKAADDEIQAALALHSENGVRLDESGAE
jgi:hypothetical protein